MKHQASKFENPERLAELNPPETLKKIGFGQNDALCDLGAGTGIFTIPAAKITNNSVLALDINDKFLEIIKEKAKKENLGNISTKKVIDGIYNYDIDTSTIDLAILVTVFHEIEDKDALLAELKRILKATGKLAIIEFHKKETPFGPPVSHRISTQDIIQIGSRYGFIPADEFDLGNNFYCLTLTTEP